MLGFAVIGALDRIFGNHFGIGTEFERGFYLLGVMGLTMVGMIVIAPVLSEFMAPIFDAVYTYLGVDPSIIPASLLANDMGGATLAKEIGKTSEIGLYNGLVVSSMMGCTISYTIPFSLSVVNKENHKELMLGILYGIITIPVGCAVVGLIMGISPFALVINLLPLILFSVLIALGLKFVPRKTVKLFSIIGMIIKGLITIGLVLGILKELAGIEIIKGLGSVKEGAWICFNSAMVLSGAFPMMYIISKIIKRPIKALGRKLKINEASAFGLVSTIVTNATTIEKMRDMDKKGIVLNAAFLTSAAFTFGGHLAFTSAFDSAYVFPMIGAKLISGFAALILALFLFKEAKN